MNTHPNTQEMFGNIPRVLAMGTRFCPLLFELSHSNGETTFTDNQRVSTRKVRKSLLAHLRTLLTGREFALFRAHIRRFSLEQQIVECILKIMGHLNEYITRHSAFITSAQEHFLLQNGQFTASGGAFLAFCSVTGTFTSLEHFYSGLVNIAAMIRRQREVILQLSQMYVVPEMLHPNGEYLLVQGRQPPPANLRVSINQLLSTARGVLFRVEILKYEFDLLVLRAFMRIWLNV